MQTEQSYWILEGRMPPVGGMTLLAPGRWRYFRPHPKKMAELFSDDFVIH
jgi:hypothetical protein